MNRLISNGVWLSDLAQEAEPNPLNERLSVISMVAKLGKAMLVSSIVVRYFSYQFSELTTYRMWTLDGRLFTGA